MWFAGEDPGLSDVIRNSVPTVSCLQPWAFCGYHAFVQLWQIYLAEQEEERFIVLGRTSWQRVHMEEYDSLLMRTRGKACRKDPGWAVAPKHTPSHLHHPIRLHLSSIRIFWFCQGITWSPKAYCLPVKPPNLILLVTLHIQIVTMAMLPSSPKCYYHASLRRWDPVTGFPVQNGQPENCIHTNNTDTDSEFRRLHLYNLCIYI